jgi:hypothetical protein
VRKKDFESFIQEKILLSQIPLSISETKPPVTYGPICGRFVGDLWAICGRFVPTEHIINNLTI